MNTKTVGTVESELAELQQKRSQLTQERQELETSIAKLEGEATVKRLESGKIGDLLTSIERRYSEKRILDTTLAALADQIAAKDTELKAAKREAGKAKVAEIEKEMTTLFGDIEQRLAELRATVEEVNARRRVLDELVAAYGVDSPWRISLNVRVFDGYLSVLQQLRRQAGG